MMMDVHSDTIPSRRDAQQQSTTTDINSNNSTTLNCLQKDVANQNKEGNGPDYKDQCRRAMPTLNLLSVDLVTQEIAAQRNTTATSASTINRSYIPLVCGVPLPMSDDHTDSHLRDSQDISTTMTRYQNEFPIETESTPVMIGTAPEQAPVPQVISVKNWETMEHRPSTLSNAEKRYWIKVVLIAIVVNTLLVLGGVIGGVCGVSGCHFTKGTTISLDTDIGTNTTISPTQSPSRHLEISYSPVIVSANAPTVDSDNKSTSTPYNTNNSGESASYPSISPTTMVHPAPSTDGTLPTTNTVGISLIIIIPIAIIVDAILILGFLFYHYTRWNKAKHKG